MRFKYLAIVSSAAPLAAIASLLALLTISCANNDVRSNQSEVQTSPESDVQTPTPVVATNISQSGTFKAAEHPTQGTVRVVAENGKRYLEFDQSFKTDFGPDLFVILHRSDAPPVSGVKKQDYVNIARLQKTSGTQRYALSDNVTLADFKSVAIWCRAFNSTFGYAPLGS